jgi:hypothetical protein
MLVYHKYIALDVVLQVMFCKECAVFKPVLGVLPFDQGPGNIAVFTDIYEVIHKSNHILLVGLNVL